MNTVITVVLGVLIFIALIFVINKICSVYLKSKIDDAMNNHMMRKYFEQERLNEELEWNVRKEV